jgi:hypothetical protein
MTITSYARLMLLSRKKVRDAEVEAAIHVCYRSPARVTGHL